MLLQITYFTALNNISRNIFFIDLRLIVAYFLSKVQKLFKDQGQSSANYNENWMSRKSLVEVT